MTDDREAALLAACRAAPEDLAARAVYADWLEERGDPRGELLRLTDDLAALPGKLAALGARIDPGWLAALGYRYRVSVTAVIGNNVAAIKALRAATTLGLWDARELVVSVSEHDAIVIVDDADRDAMRKIVETCASTMTLLVEPRLPGSLRVRRTKRSGYRVTLVAVTDRDAAERLVFQQGWDFDEAARLVAGLPGTPIVLVQSQDARVAIEVAVAAGKVGTVTVEHA